MRLFFQRIARVCVVPLAFAMPIAAEAEPAPEPEVGEFEETGVYLIGTALYAIPTEKDNLEDSNNAALGTDKTNVDDAWGFGTRLGYRIHKNLGLEAEFDMLNNIQLDGQTAGVESKTDIRLFHITANAKGYLFTGRFQPYAILGAGWGRSEVSPPAANSERNDGFVGRMGAGMDIYGSRDVALTTEVTYLFSPSSHLDDLDHVSFKAGLVLRFYPLD